MKRFAAFALTLAIGLPLAAQEYRASLLGQVSDASKSAVPNATVKATKQDTNVSKETVTNEQGIYTIPGLDPGVYTVTVTASGFQTVRRSEIVLQVAQKLSLPITMEGGAVTQEITVVGEQELVQTATASRGLVFDPLQVQELPLNGRQSYMLMRFSPGVMFSQRQFGSSGYSGTRAWDVNGNFTMNGGRTGTNQFLLNGAPISTDGTFNLAPNVEAIQEFKVMVNTYDAQYARSGGGHVNTTLKSGTNNWHGSFFDFWRNRVLDANTRQNNASGQARGYRNQHQYGGVIGGPIRKDKDFVFFSFEGWQERVPFPSVASVPPMEIRGGDFSTYVPQGQSSTIKIYDQMTSVPCTTAGVSCISGGIYKRAPFAGNRIPQSRLSPIALKILQYYPAPNFTPQRIDQNFVRGDNTGRYRYEQPMARWDHVFTDKHRMNFLFTFQDGSEFRNQNGFDAPAQTGNMPGTVRRDMSYMVSYDWTLTPTRILHWQASFNRFVQNFPNFSDASFTYDKVGIKNIPNAATFPTKLMPQVQIGGYNNIFGARFMNQSSRQQANYQVNISEVRGRHSLKYGMEWALVLRHNKDSGDPTRRLEFTSTWSQQHYGRRASGILDGTQLADFLLGYQNAGNLNYNDTFLRREPYIGVFVQDDWKVNNKLTINVGLRYDIQYPVLEIHDRLVSGFDFDTVNKQLSDQVIPVWQKNAATIKDYPAAPSVIKGGLLYAGVNGQPRRIQHFDFTNIQPRIGFAYQFMNKTVMRGGAGIFHRTATQGGVTTGFSQTTPYLPSANGGLTHRAGLTGPYSLEDPWAAGIIPPVGPSLGLNTSVGAGVSYDDPNRPIPRTFQWSYTIERQLAWNQVLEVSYVGSLTNKEPIGIQLSDMGQKDYAAAFLNPSYYQATVANPWYGILPNNVALGNSALISRRELLRRIPQFNSVVNNIMPVGKAWYHGLQVRYERRMMGSRSKGGALTWVLAYTWSKQMEKWLRQNFAFEWMDRVNRVTSIDRTHNFQLTGIYDLPVGKGRAFGSEMNSVADAVAGGWNLNWTVGYQTGVPLGAWQSWEYTCGNPVAGDRSESRWFDTTKSCYRQLQPFELQQLNGYFHQIRSHAATQVDLALAKKFNLSERWQVEIRGEAFNAFNTPLRQDPSTDPNSASFGILPVQQNNFPRNIQIGARVRF